MSLNPRSARILRNQAIFQSLGDAWIEEMAKNSVIHELDAETKYHARFPFLMITGRLRRFSKVKANKRAVLIEVLEGPNISGNENDLYSEYKTETPCTLITLDPGQFQTAQVRFPRFLHMLYANALERLRILERSITLESCASPDLRVLDHLFEFAWRYGSYSTQDGIILDHIRVPKTQLSELTAIPYRTLHRCIENLVDKNLIIELKGQGHWQFPNPHAVLKLLEGFGPLGRTSSFDSAIVNQKQNLIRKIKNES